MKTRTKIIYSAFLLFLLACSREKMAPVPPTATHPMISAFSSGFISRSSAIRVVFVADMIDSSRINSIVDTSPFSFSPQIKGETTWRDRRTLQFHPAEWLPPGKLYNAELNLKKIFAEGIGEDRFQFTFNTILPTMQITIDGLSPMDIADAAAQRLSGRLEFSDVMVLQDVEKVVSAEYDHRPMEIVWGSQDDRVFTFFIDNVIRDKREKEMRIRWDGRALDIAERGEREIKIPSLADFSVTQVRAIRRDQQFVEIRFSDPLQKPQSLEGLIQVSDYDDLRYTIDNNIIRVYSNMPFMGDLLVTVQAGIVNQNGFRLPENSVHQVTFDQLKPSVAFVGNGVILPTTQGLTIPIETVNIRSVLVTAIRISEERIPQFLQVNNYDGDRELHRVGREVWKQIVDLGVQPTDKNQTKRFGLNVTPLVTSKPPGLYRLVLTFRRPFLLYDCDDNTVDQPIDLDLASWDDEDDYNYWPMGDTDLDWNEFYNQRDNPCHPAFYYPWWDQDITVSRNILISDIGLIAKKGENNALLAAVTDLKTAKPMANVSLTVYDFQQTQIGSAKSNADGFAEISCSRKPFLLVAEQGDQSGYLKLNDGAALSISHFDVGGEAVPQGIKGFIYGERGVWRPGDAIFLTFILPDDGKLPPHHPVSLEFYNPRGQQVLTQTQTRSINGFYTFRLSTAADAPTGNWRAKCIVGGASFEKTIKIESIMPNRLAIDLDFGGRTELPAEPTTATLSAAWLFGAKADNLLARVEGRLTPIDTRFESFPKYTFDDPLSTFETESCTVFEGVLDQEGKARIPINVGAAVAPPGKVNVVFNTRVFEPGGAFSSHRLSMPMSPYDHYVGLSLPIKDPDSPTLATDSTHTINIARVTSSGKAEGNEYVELSLYKIKWRWWWEKEQESLAEYTSAESYRPVQSAVVPLRNGMGQWKLQLPQSEWGRYLIHIKDKNGRHSSGAIVYVDVPGWEGRGRKDSADGAGILVFSSDKTQYNVGETVTISIPAGKGGRGLISLETGSQVIQSEWFEPKTSVYRYTFKASSDMTPTLYAHVSYLQPHLQTANDLPIRLYGVIPIAIVDRATFLKPVIDCADEIRPDVPVTISIREATGKPMTYTLALVDQGLLDLTRFATPNPWNHFYSREALTVKTWDIYDWVAGAYGGKLERLLAIGGDEHAEVESRLQANRFPPLVQFLGPFDLNASKTQTHTLNLPPYIGAARLMVVAGAGRAFGSAEKSVVVRKPLILLATLPRTLSIQEQVSLPLSLFVMDEALRTVTVNAKVEGAAEISGDNTQTLIAPRSGEYQLQFKVKTLREGTARVYLSAVSGVETAEQKIEIAVRNPMGLQTQVKTSLLQAGEEWAPQLDLPGKPGSNLITLEVSRIPPLDLKRRLEFLINYPHGCAEQTTSAVFPQLYLQKLVDLPRERQQEIEKNVKAGINKLRSFQTDDGGFSYWPGEGQSDPWCTNYVGCFLLEAKQAGYMIPAAQLEQWKRYQQRTAQGWLAGDEQSTLIQADRLYSMALSGSADLASMNRLKERKNLSVTAKWRLAAAYQLAGQKEAALSLASGSTTLAPYRELSGTYGSDVRDTAILLETLTLLNDPKRAFPLVQALSASLSSDAWLSTQTTSFALAAIARYAGLFDNDKSPFTYSVGLNNSAKEDRSSSMPLVQQQWEIETDTTAQVSLRNSSKIPLYARLLLQGIPRIGRETASANGLELSVDYLNDQDQAIDISTLAQGEDFWAQVSVRHTGLGSAYEELALTQTFPPGWEIQNVRLTDDDLEPHTFNYQDIRDDRVLTYFDLNRGELMTVKIRLTAAYLGRYYLPPMQVEAMYDASINGRDRGRWIEVVTPD